MSEDLLVLREILQRELETINAYERMLERVEDPSLRQVIEHVTDEEREHVSEMYYLIMERDPRQAIRSEQGRSQLAGMALLSSANQTAAASAGLGADVLISNANRGTTETITGERLPVSPPIFPDGAWSVGPLKGRSP